MLLEAFIYVEDIINKYNIQILRLMFLSFTLIICIGGGLILAFESVVPERIKRLILYGKLSKTSVNDSKRSSIVFNIEVSKSWFSHFYIFATCFSLWELYLILKCFINQQHANEYVLRFLDFMGGGHNNRKALVSLTSTTLAILLMSLQIMRRCYETNFVQIFSKKNHMNFTTYVVSFMYYFGVILLFLLHTEGFVKDSQPPTNFKFDKISKFQYICICTFLFSWLQQWKSNITLVNLRRDPKSGKKINTEKHLIPRGGFFDLISAPHMLFEILMYLSIYGIIPENVTYRFALIFVVVNQIIIALLNHNWYKENFPDYPNHRKAIIPYVL